MIPLTGRGLLFIALATTKVYFLHEDKLWSVDLDGTHLRSIMSTEHASSFDFHYEKRKIYWVNSKDGKVCLKLFLIQLMLVCKIVTTLKNLTLSQSG